MPLSMALSAKRYYIISLRKPIIILVSLELSITLLLAEIILVYLDLALKLFPRFSTLSTFDFDSFYSVDHSLMN